MSVIVVTSRVIGTWLGNWLGVVELPQKLKARREEITRIKSQGSN